MSDKKYSKAQRQIAREILAELEHQWKELETDNTSHLFYRLHFFIKQTYLSEDNNK